MKIANQGAVTQTRAHHHTQFLQMVVVVFGVIFVVLWGCWEGYVPRLAHDMGVIFTVLFLVILALGMTLALICSLYVSLWFNRVKEIGTNRAELKRLFGVSDALTARRIDMLNTEMHEVLKNRLENLWFIATLALVLGFVGTIVGLADYAFKAFEGSAVTADSFSKAWPQFMFGGRVALQTSAAGAFVWVMLTVMYYKLKNSVTKYENRQARALEHCIEE